MKNALMFTYLILLFSGIAQADLFKAKDSEYSKAASRLSYAMAKNPGEIRSQKDGIPTSLKEARQVFQRVCLQQVENYRYDKTLEITDLGNLMQLNFRCQDKSHFSPLEHTVQFIAILDKNESLLDLQVVKIGESPDEAFTTEDGVQLVMAVAAGTLASGLLAQALYPDQQDKLQHAIGGSLIAASATAAAYYGFRLTKEKSYWVGVAASVLAGILKEVYDNSHRQSHTPDTKDAISTALGGVMGGLMVRIKFEF